MLLRQDMSTAPPPAPERRRGDRRKHHPAINLRHLGFGGRRHRCRRAEDRRNRYVDSYDAPLLALTLAILACCCLDAAFTLTLLSLGAVELNPLMAGLIDRDIQAFVVAKFALTALGLVFLVIRHNFRLVPGVRIGHVLPVLFAAYASLIAYEVALLARPPL